MTDTPTEAKPESERDFLLWAIDRLTEINPSNYDHDDVCEMNAASVEVSLAMQARLTAHAASPPAPAAEPVAWIPAKQLDEVRDLASGIDLEYWFVKIIHAYVLPAEGRIPVYLSPPTTDAIRAQARREALEEAAKVVLHYDETLNRSTGIFDGLAEQIRTLAGKGEAE